MISFETCPYCKKTPKIQLSQTHSSEIEKNQKILTAPLTNLHLKVTVNDEYYQCPHCGTYYRFESEFTGSVNYYDLRLVRITIIEALNAFQSDFKTEGDFNRIYHEAKNSPAANLKEIEKMLSSNLSGAREFAAETLSDFYKQEKDLISLKALLNQPDTDIKLGVLWSYAEIPWRSYMLETPRLNQWNGIFSFKPFGKLSSILKIIIDLLSDSDQRIRKICKNFLQIYFLGKGNKLTEKLLKIPQKKWSVELKQILIEHFYPNTQDHSYQELCNFLIDSEKEVRQEALTRIYDTYCEKEIPIYLEYIKKISKENKNHEIQWFLDHPDAGLENDDDDYYD